MLTTVGLGQVNMTPKEKLEALSHLILQAPLDKKNIDELKLKAEVYVPAIQEALNELEELKRVPTAKEVCKAIQEHELLELYRKLSKELHIEIETDWSDDWDGTHDFETLDC